MKPSGADRLSDILGHVAVDDRGHEITAVPELLRMLDLIGALVTTGAAGCQKARVRQIRDQGEC